MTGKGIVRRIDELGRIVIPKELRRTMGIREGEQIEIIPVSNHELTLRKYSQLKILEKVAEDYSKILEECLGREIIVCDKAVVLAHSSKGIKMIGENISNTLHNLLDERKAIRLTNSTAVRKGDTREYESQHIFPIIANGDLYGGIMVVGAITDEQVAICHAVVKCLESQLA